MKVKRYNNRNASRRSLLTEVERTEAEAIVRERYPTAKAIEVHPWREGIYAEVWGAKSAKIVRVA